MKLLPILLWPRQLSETHECTDAYTRKQAALLPPHARTHTHARSVSAGDQQLCRLHFAATAAAARAPRLCSRSHGTAAARETGAKRSVQETPRCPGHSSSGSFSGEPGRAQSEVHGPRHLGTRWLLGCQRVPGPWPSPSEVLTWTSSRQWTLWASSPRGLRMAEEGVTT